MKSYYYHSRLTIGWRIFNHIENSSSHTHNFDECIYHHIIIEVCLYRCKNCYSILHNLKEHSKQKSDIFIIIINIYYTLP